MAGIALVFVFSLIIQLVAEGIAWVTSTRVEFLFPLGIRYAFTDIPHLISVLFSITVLGAIVGSFFYWRTRRFEQRHASRFWLQD